jgi:molybdopterin synthase catalytic subunit
MKQFDIALKHKTSNIASFSHRKNIMSDDQQLLHQPFDARDVESFLISVAPTLPSLESIHSFLTHPACGAISLFSGTTRNNFNGKIVTSLSYEGYVPMAIKELNKLCGEAKARFGVEKIVAVHLLGDCPVGQVSVIVGSCGAHRRETIRCTEYLIDELKAR